MKTYENAVFYEGEDEARKRVSNWLAKHWDSTENEGGLSVEIYEYGSEDEDPFEEVEFDLTSTPDVIARKIVEAATECCDGLESGKARFKCKLDGVSRSSVTFTITVPERGMLDEDDLDESPNQRGQTMQQMRHNERLIKNHTVAFTQAVEAFKEVAESYKSMLETKDKRIETLESGYTSTIRTFEELMSARHVRDLEVKRLENDERRKDQVAGTLMQLAPHLLGKIMGTPPPAQMAPPPATGGIPQRTPIEVGLEGFLNTFDKTQLDNLVASGILRQEQIMGLVQLASMIKEREEAEKGQKTSDN